MKMPVPTIELTTMPTTWGELRPRRRLESWGLSRSAVPSSARLLLSEEFASDRNLQLTVFAEPAAKPASAYTRRKGMSTRHGAQSKGNNTTWIIAICGATVPACCSAPLPKLAKQLRPRANKI